MHANTVNYTINYHNNRNKNKLPCRTVFKLNIYHTLNLSYYWFAYFVKTLIFDLRIFISCANRRHALVNYNGTKSDFEQDQPTYRH